VTEDDKYLIRRRRIKKHQVYGLMFKSTLYKITIKGYRMLSSFGVNMSKEIARYEKWLEEINPNLKHGAREKQMLPGGVEKVKAIAEGLVAKFIT